MYVEQDKNDKNVGYLKGLVNSMMHLTVTTDLLSPSYNPRCRVFGEVSDLPSGSPKEVVVDRSEVDSRV